MFWPSHAHNRRSVLAAGAGLAVAVTVTATSPRRQDGYSNPFYWRGFADIDIIRVDNTRYCSASPMHFSQGPPPAFLRPGQLGIRRRFFMRYRFGIPNHATQKLAGAAAVNHFEVAAP